MALVEGALQEVGGGSPSYEQLSKCVETLRGVAHSLRKPDRQTAVLHKLRQVRARAEHGGRASRAGEPLACLGLDRPLECEGLPLCSSDKWLCCGGVDVVVVGARAVVCVALPAPRCVARLGAR